MSEEEARTEEWVYLGFRDNAGKSTAWLCADGKVRYWDERTSYATGGIYEVSVSPRDDGLVTRHGSPRFLRLHPDEGQRAQWRAEEVTDLALLDHAARERKAKRDDPLEDALAPLLAIAGKLRTTRHRTAFALYVLDRIRRAS